MNQSGGVKGLVGCLKAGKDKVREDIGYRDAGHLKYSIDLINNPYAAFWSALKVFLTVDGKWAGGICEPFTISGTCAGIQTFRTECSLKIVFFLKMLLIF